MIFNFPRAIFVNKNGIVGQCFHIESELRELQESITEPDIFHTAEEAIDLLHSIETLLRILEEKHGVDLNDVGDYVQAKNKRRGYYL